jgi:hypothetical protein
VTAELTTFANLPSPKVRKQALVDRRGQPGRAPALATFRRPPARTRHSGAWLSGGTSPTISAVMEAPSAEKRAAQLAHVLARAVRDGEVNAIDAARVLKHELRRRNTNRSHTLAVRSTGAQASIDKYAPERRPRNDSDEALHADHVYPFTSTLFYEVTTLDGWVDELRRLATVVCVTARENYALEQIENTGVDGPAKYAAVVFSTPVPW